MTRDYPKLKPFSKQPSSNLSLKFLPQKLKIVRNRTQAMATSDVVAYLSGQAGARSYHKIRAEQLSLEGSTVDSNVEEIATLGCGRGKRNSSHPVAAQVVEMLVLDFRVWQVPTTWQASTISSSKCSLATTTVVLVCLLFVALLAQISVHQLRCGMCLSSQGV